MKRLGILLLVFATVLGLRVPPADAVYEPPGGATFNVPQPWGTHAQRFRIVETVEKAINNVPAGETIVIATFFLDRPESVDALINACQRGVRVRVILDGGVDNKQANRLVSVLNSDNLNQDVNKDGIPDLPGPSCWNVSDATTLPPAEAAASVAQDVDASTDWGADHSYVTKCASSCRGATRASNMHDKFFAFSKSGAADDVVMVSSSNLNWGGAVKGWNDLYTVKNNPVLFDKFKAIHREMTDDKAAPVQYQTQTVGPYEARFFPKPGSTASTDPTMQDLRAIKCSSAFGATRVNVSMFYWAGDRGKYIASKLISLGKAGCKVSIIYGAPSHDIWLQLRAAAVKHQISLYDSRKQLNSNPGPEVRTHGKYILIKGNYRGDSAARVVSTGSQNWVAYALLKADELTLNVDSDAAYRDYIDNWTVVRNHSVRVPRS